MLLLPCAGAMAQFASKPADARSSALGSCTVGSEDERYVALDIRQDYLTAGMATSRLCYAGPVGERGLVRVGYSHFGDADYAEHQLGLHAGLAVGGGLTVGVGGRYCVLAVGDGHYDTRRWLSAQAAIRYVAGKRLAFHAVADSRPWRADEPWQLCVGMCYRATSRVRTYLEVDNDDGWRVHMGTEYCYRQRLFFRAGMATAPLVVSAGVGLRHGRCLVDVSVEDHAVLGLSPQMGLAVCF